MSKGEIENTNENTALSYVMLVTKHWTSYLQV